MAVQAQHCTLAGRPGGRPLVVLSHNQSSGRSIGWSTDCLPLLLLPLGGRPLQCLSPNVHVYARAVDRAVNWATVFGRVLTSWHALGCLLQ